MIQVDIYVPSVNQEYEFGLDETARISAVTEEVASLVSQKEQCEIWGNSAELLLCSVRDKSILSPEHTLEEYRISNGSRLLLV